MSSRPVSFANRVLHAQIEKLLKLLRFILTKGNFRRQRDRLLGVFELLEQALTTFLEVYGIGRTRSAQSLTRSFVIERLGCGTWLCRITHIMLDGLWRVPRFAYASGVLHLRERERLGHYRMLREPLAGFSRSVAGATPFLSGLGEAAAPLWQCFLWTPERLGGAPPRARPCVIIGSWRAGGSNPSS